MNPTPTLQRLAATYAALSSYTDQGVVLRLHRNDEAPDESLFRTWFIRPGRLRLDWRSHHPYPPLRNLVTNHVVSSDGTRVWRWQDRPPRFDEEQELGLAFAGAETIAVPNLLIPGEIGSFPFDNLNDVRIEQDNVQGVECFCIVGEHPVGGEYRVWVGESDCLIRRIRTDYRTPIEENDVYSGVTETIYHFIQPAANIDPAIFGKVESLIEAG